MSVKPQQAKTATQRWSPLRLACFEADWASSFEDRQSVLPIMELLERQDWIRFFHRRVATEEQFVADVTKWSKQKRYARYRVAYIGAHGDHGKLAIDRSEGFSLERLHELDLSGRVVYLASCSSDTSKGLDVLSRLRGETGARAVLGFTEPIDWIESAAFDMLLLSWLAWEQDRATWPLPALRSVVRNYPDLVKTLGFVYVMKSARSDTRR